MAQAEPESALRSCWRQAKSKTWEPNQRSGPMPSGDDDGGPILYVPAFTRVAILCRRGERGVVEVRGVSPLFQEDGLDFWEEHAFPKAATHAAGNAAGTVDKPVCSAVAWFGSGCRMNPSRDTQGSGNKDREFVATLPSNSRRPA